jgi:hypothetical protein
MCSADGSVVDVQRVLDIDLDFFVCPVVHWASEERPAAEEHSVWPAVEAAEFLRDRCGLTEPLPGFMTENHDDLFPMWRRAVEGGILKPPFHVTHVDAHADLGLGDAGYVYLMSSLLLQDPENRAYPTPPPGGTGVTEGNFLLYAIACRWINDLTYVFGEDGGSDELPYVMKGFDPHADYIQLASMTESEINRLNMRLDERQPIVSHLEPEIPYRACRWQDFRADESYDFICLTRSPRYAPASADPLYDEIPTTFIEPTTTISPQA